MSTSVPNPPPGFEVEEDPPLPSGYILDRRGVKFGEPKPEPTGLGSRVLTGLMDPVVGAAQLADKAINPIRQAVAPGAMSMDDYVRQRDAEYKAPEGVDWGRMGGNMANPLNYLGGGGGLGRMVGQGAVSAAMAPTEAGDDGGTYLLKKAGQAGLGGVFGGAGGALTRGVARPTADAQALIRQGVRLTPGQAAGGFWNNVEQKLTSLPFAGDVIDRGRRRAVEDVQERAIERATGTPGLRTVRAANDAIEDAYDQAVPHIRANPGGIFEAAQAYNAALQNPRLIPEYRDILTGLWDKHFSQYSLLQGRGLKELDSELGSLSRDYLKGSPHDRVLGQAINDIKVAMRQGWAQGGGMPAVEAGRLNAANRAYRGMIPINEVASRRADELAMPSPLRKALAKQDRTQVTRRYDDLLDPAARTLTQTIPDSGTAGRSALQSPMKMALGLGASLPAWLATSGPGARVLLGESRGQQLLGPYADPAIQAMIAALRE